MAYCGAPTGEAGRYDQWCSTVYLVPESQRKDNGEEAIRTYHPTG